MHIVTYFMLEKMINVITRYYEKQTNVSIYLPIYLNKYLDEHYIK
jgi:hypothetical protein